MIYLATTNELRNEADVVLALGSRMGETDWWGKPPYWAPPARQKLIQVDLDPAVFGFNKPVNLAVLGDVKVFMKLL
jgi:acetolactate synthase-1/2/3 large subunit